MDEKSITQYVRRTLVRDWVKVMFVTHETEKYSHLDAVRFALRGGCKCIQLRMKNVPPDMLLPIAIQAKLLCMKKKALLIIDDYVELAKEVGANGVHLGKTDMPIEEARNILGNTPIIGGTANTFEDVKRLYQAGVDYIGCGPFRFTTTKENLSPVLGLSGLKKIKTKMSTDEIMTPIIAIGGITAQDVPDILRCNIDGVAVSGAVLKAEKPAIEMKKIIELNRWS